MNRDNSNMNLSDPELMETVRKIVEIQAERGKANAKKRKRAERKAAAWKWLKDNFIPIVSVIIAALTFYYTCR